MPKNRGWFRVYDRMIDSPEILELTDTQFRIIVSMWALASSGGEENGIIEYKNGALWRRVAPQVPKEDFIKIIDTLVAIGLLVGVDGHYMPNNWAKHQYSPKTRPDSHVWREIRTRIFLRDNYTCSYCGARGVKLECDHIIPVSQGGTHDDENLTTACKACNRSKFNRTPEEWRHEQ